MFAAGNVRFYRNPLPAAGCLPNSFAPSISRIPCYIARVVSEPNVTQTAAWPFLSTRSKRLQAAVLSAFFPGAGQLLMRQRRKAVILAFLFVALLLLVYPLRLLRFYPGLLLVVVIWLGLSLYASGAALFSPSDAVGPVYSKRWLVAIIVLVYIGINLVLTPLLLLAGFRAMKFGSSAMQPTLFAGDKFMVDGNYYRKEPLEHNDLVLIRRSDLKTVKRVIAVAGDTIEARNREILVNGSVVNEPFIQHIDAPGTDPDMDSFGPTIVPPGHVFLMGDNRDVSLDSRSGDFGPLSTDAIIGKPLYIYMSPVKERRGKQLR